MSIFSCTRDDGTIHRAKVVGVTLALTAVAMTIAYVASKRFGQDPGNVTILPVDPPKSIPMPRPLPGPVEKPICLGPPVRAYEIDLPAELTKGWSPDPVQTLENIEQQILNRGQSNRLYTLRNGRDRLKVRVVVDQLNITIKREVSDSFFKNRFVQIVEEMATCHRPQLPCAISNL